VVMRQIKLPVGDVRAAVRAARAIMRQPRGQQLAASGMATSFGRVNCR
jgi:hypothetical protein